MDTLWNIDTIISILKPVVLQKGTQNNANGIKIDSFLTMPNDLYVAIDSSKYDHKDGSLGFSANEDSVFGLGGVLDGHTNLKDAFEKGAKFFIIDKNNYHVGFNVFPEIWILLVKDSLDALAKLARYRLENQKTKVIGVTGSTGKTSTTYAVATCLRAKYKVRQFYRTRTSYLSLIMDVLNKLQPTDDFLVVEMQMDGLNQIASFCSVTPPDFAIITNVNNSHVQRLGSPESILKAKLEIYSGMRDNGILIVNGDNQTIFNWIQTQKDNRFFVYGSSSHFNLYASDILISTKSAKAEFNLNYGDKALPASTTIVGKHAVYTGLAAASVTALNGFSLEETCVSIKSIRSVPGRLQCFLGQNGCYVLDDAYNANLFSMTAAIDALLSLPAKRRIAFIGSMLELAEFSERDHRILGSKLTTSVDVLITVGESAYYVADEVLKKGFSKQHLYCTDSVEDAISLIPYLSLDNQTAVLVKGSGAMRMDRITPYLLSTPIG